MKQNAIYNVLTREYQCVAQLEREDDLAILKDTAKTSKLQGIWNTVSAASMDDHELAVAKWIGKMLNFSSN